MNTAKLPFFILAALQITFMSQSYAVEKASGDTGPIHGKKPVGTAELEIIKTVEGGEIPLLDSESETQNTPIPEEGKLKVLNADIDLLPKDKRDDFFNYLPKINSSTIVVEDADLDGYNQNDEPANVNIEINTALTLSGEVSAEASNDSSPQPISNTEPVVLDQPNGLNYAVKWYFKDRLNPDDPVDVPINLPLFSTLKDTYPAETISAYLPKGLPGRVWTGEQGEASENGTVPITTQGIPYENNTLLKSPEYQFKIPPRAPFIFIRNTFPIERVAELSQNRDYINTWWGDNSNLTWQRPLPPTKENWPLNDIFSINPENNDNSTDVISDTYPFIQIKSIDPNNKVNFPTNGFKNAEFRIVTPMMYRNYTWTSSHPEFASVNDQSGVVRLLKAPPNANTEISITAVPKIPLIDTSGVSHAPNTPNNPTIEHRFTLKRWFVHSGETLGRERTLSFNRAYNACVNHDYQQSNPYVIPSVTAITSISPETSRSNWIDNYAPPRALTTDNTKLISLLEEWGNPNNILTDQTWSYQTNDKLLMTMSLDATPTLGDATRIDLGRYHAYPDAPNFYYFSGFSGLYSETGWIYPDFLEGFEYPAQYLDDGIIPFTSSHVSLATGVAGLNHTDLSRLNFLCVRNLDGTLDTPAINNVKVDIKREPGYTTYTATYDFSGNENGSYYAWITDKRFENTPFELTDDQIEGIEFIDDLTGFDTHELFTELFPLSPEIVTERTLRPVGPNGEIEPYRADDRGTQPHTLILFSYDKSKAQQGRAWGNYIAADTGSKQYNAILGVNIGLNPILKDRTGKQVEEAMAFTPWFKEAFLEVMGNRTLQGGNSPEPLPTEDIIVTLSWDKDAIAALPAADVTRINQLMGENVTSPEQWELARFIDITPMPGDVGSGTLNDPEKRIRFRQPPLFVPIKVNLSANNNYLSVEEDNFILHPPIWLTNPEPTITLKVESLDYCERMEDDFFAAGNPEPNPIVRHPSLDLDDLKDEQNIYSEYYRFGDNGKLDLIWVINYPFETDPNSAGFLPWKTASYMTPSFYLLQNYRIKNSWGSYTNYGGSWDAMKIGITANNIRYWSLEKFIAPYEGSREDFYTVWVSLTDYTKTHTDAINWTPFSAFTICNAHMDSPFRKPFLTLEELEAKGL